MALHDWNVVYKGRDGISVAKTVHAGYFDIEYGFVHFLIDGPDAATAGPDKVFSVAVECLTSIERLT